MQVKKQQLEPDMEQQTGSKLENEYVKAVCCHPAYYCVYQNLNLACLLNRNDLLLHSGKYPLAESWQQPHRGYSLLQDFRLGSLVPETSS